MLACVRPVTMGHVDCVTSTDGSRATRASAQPGRPPVEPAGADDFWDRPKGGDAGAGARAGPHACEDRAADIAVELER